MAGFTNGLGQLIDLYVCASPVMSISNKASGKYLVYSLQYSLALSQICYLKLYMQNLEFIIHISDQRN